MLKFKFSTIILMSAISLFLFEGCYDIVNNRDLSVRNKTSREISTLYTNGVKPDQTQGKIAFFTSDQNVIPPDSCRDIIIGGRENAWSQYIQEGRTKMLSIYIFDTDTLRKYDGTFSIEELKYKHKYLKEYKYSENDLRKINWKIVYP